MNEYDYKNLTPFKWFILENFPFIEETFDALTNYQLFCKLGEEINKIIDTVNLSGEQVENLTNAFIQLQNYVNNYFDNLDVQDEIDNKLDEMATNGDLDLIVAKYVKIQEVNYIKDICTLENRPSNVTRDLNGGCYCGGNLIACYFSNTHTIQIISLSTGQVLREYSNANFGHGNGMCKKGNYLYLTGTGSTSTNKIYKIPFDTLDSHEVIDPFGNNLIPVNTNISSICYSQNTNHFYITGGLPFPTLTCYEMNEDFTELINTYTYDNGTSSYGGFITNICHWKEYIVVNYNYGKTQLFDENDFSLYKEIMIDKNVGNRYYNEIEWLDSYENNELIFGAICHGGENYGNGIYSFGTCNLYNSVRDFPGNYRRGKSTTGEINTRQNHVFVNTNASFNVKRDGTSENPFISIYEASNSTQLDGFNETIIHIVSGSDLTQEGIYIANTGIVRIIAPNDNMLCRNMRFRCNNEIYIKGITPINTLVIDDTNVTIESIPSNETEIDLDGSSTSKLNILTNAHKIKLKGKSKGKISFNYFNQEHGIVGVANSTADGYTDFVECRNIENVCQRGRLEGNNYSPSKSMTFFTNSASIKEISILVGNYRVSLPQINVYSNIGYDIKLPDDSLLHVVINYDSSTYTNRTVLKFVITHPTLIIYDSLIVY